MPQLVTRISEELAAAVDELVADGLVASRSEAVRIGLEHLVDRHKRDRIGAEIVRGYLAMPQSDSEIGWSEEACVQMIAEEPW